MTNTSQRSILPRLNPLFRISTWFMENRFITWVGNSASEFACFEDLLPKTRRTKRIVLTAALVQVS
jgi:hypothetical protein